MRGGVVFDGVSPHRARYDLRIVDGTIAEVGEALPVDGGTIVDAEQLWVLPGFVDAHSHADAAALTGDGMEQRALAGVTTEIVGQDGLGLSFATGSTRAAMQETLAPIAGALPGEEFGDVAGYLGAIDRASFARVASLVPHGTIRSAVIGSELREASAEEIAAMRDRVELGLAQGAAGVSTGLSYPPALAASTDELVAVTAGVPKGTPYVTHIRDYGAGFDRALDEAFDICRRTPLDLHLSHLHVSGPGRDRLAESYLPYLAEARATWDSYPYTSGCTFIRALLPASAQHLDLAQLAVRLGEPGQESALIAELDAGGPGATVAGGWDTIFLAGLDGTAIADWQARTVAALAAATRTTPGAVVVRAIRETAGAACIIVDHGHPANVRAIAEGPGHLVGSDGIMGSGVPHPRATNAFFRFLSWAARGSVSVTVEEMVARMTAKTAGRFRLPVGRLAAGRPADVLVIDPAALSEGPDFGHATPTSVVHSFLAGERAVIDGRWRGDAQPGLALRANQPGKDQSSS